MTERVAFAVSLILFSACGSDVVALQTRAAPFVADFDRFEQWALRAAIAAPSFPTEDARRAALFSPLRQMQRAKQAWVVVGEENPMVWRQDRSEEALLTSLTWRTARFGDRGERDISTSEEDPTRLWIARTSRLASIGTVRVAVCFDAAQLVQ